MIRADNRGNRRLQAGNRENPRLVPGSPRWRTSPEPADEDLGLLQAFLSRGRPVRDTALDGSGLAWFALITTILSPGWKTLTPPESNRCDTPLRITVSTISPRALSRTGASPTSSGRTSRSEICS